MAVQFETNGMGNQWAKNEMKRNGGRQEELRQKYYFIWGYIKS